MLEDKPLFLHQIVLTITADVDGGHAPLRYHARNGSCWRGGDPACPLLVL